MNSTAFAGYWPSAWPAEDGGPARRQAPLTGSGLNLQPGEQLIATSRDAIAATMVVLRDAGEAYLLRHTAGNDAISWIERFDPITLEAIERSPDLPGGPTWPGGLAAHANGALYVVFGRHAHKLAADSTLLASVALPRNRPYNSFVVFPDGHLVTKDFGGALPAAVTVADDVAPSELVVLEPDGLQIVARLELPEPSIARLSADGDQLYVVGDSSLFSVAWTGTDLELGLTAKYRTLPGQTYGWDAVIDAGAAWFLDNGEGSERYVGTLRDRGVSAAPLHLVRVDLATGAVALAEVCGLTNGLIANPPAIDSRRGIAVGYDSGNGVVTAFDFDLTVRWQKHLEHASHPLLFPDTGELLLGDYDASRSADQLVVLDIDTGDERARVDTGSPVQSVLFPAPGFDRDVYLCSFTTLTRVGVDATMAP